MQIELWKNFSKRKNSTKTPASAGEIKNVVLKDNTSFENPVFLLNSNEFDYNYVKWKNHYYFIQDITIVSNDHFEFSCVQDVLATHKSSILNTTAFVEYSSSNYNSNILDRRIGSSENVSVNKVTQDIVEFSTDGVYMVSVINSNTSEGNRYYVDATNLQKLADYVTTFEDPTSDILDLFVKQFGSVREAIAGLTWMPFYPLGVNVSNIKLGNQPTGASGKTLFNNLVMKGAETWTIEIPWVHSGPRRSMDNVFIYLPCIGNVQLNTMKYKNYSGVTIELFKDYTNGGVLYALRPSGNNDYEYYFATAGTSLPFMTYAQGVTGGMLQGFAELIRIPGSTNPGSALVDRFMDSGSDYSMIGGYGGAALGYAAGELNNIEVTVYGHEYSCTQESMATTYGRPLFNSVSLSTLTGFVKCSNASVDIADMEGDKDAVNNLLNSGIYIE